MNRNIPNWVMGYVEYTKHMEAPDLFHMWTAIGTVAGALRGKVWIDMGYFKWKPNFFIILVAPPGIVSKSTTLGVGMSLLRELESVHFGPDSVTWQALTESFIEAQEIVKDVGPMSALTIAASELGTFLDPRNREMIDVLCDLWDGRDVPWKRRTKAEGLSEIRNPWLNFLGCTTPGWLEENFPEYAIKGGFTSRTVFVYADAKRDLIAYPNLRLDEFKQEFATLRRHLINDLRKIAIIQGQYYLTKDAYTWGSKWYAKHWEQDAHIHLDRETYGGYLARKQTHIHKVAMVLAASVSDEMVISEGHLVQAAYLVTQLEDQMINVFRHITDNRDAMLSMQMFEMLRNTSEGSLSKKDLWKQMIYRCSYEEYERAAKGLISAELIYERTAGTTILFRLPSRGKAPSLQERSDDTIAHWESLARADSPSGSGPLDSSTKQSCLSEEPDQEPNH
ncbi:hypothetical protein LCGC14_0491380 [marine sediment metagenome]|uniref:DUF3987 domain-containing protein n=2 Tax=marine sediment metagenome TaxID=412755 RepID=A0A0F9S6F6_9ZZZZ